MVGSPQYNLGIRDETWLSWWKLKSYYIIMRETLAHKSIYDHLTRIAIVDEIINANASKAPQEAKH